MRKTWKYSSHEWMWGGHRGGGGLVLHSKLENKFSTWWGLESKTAVDGWSNVLLGSWPPSRPAYVPMTSLTWWMLPGYSPFSLVFHPCVYVNTKKGKNGGGLGTRLSDPLLICVCHLITWCFHNLSYLIHFISWFNFQTCMQTLHYKSKGSC